MIFSPCFTCLGGLIGAEAEEVGLADFTQVILIKIEFLHSPAFHFLHRFLEGFGEPRLLDILLIGFCQQIDLRFQGVVLDVVCRINGRTGINGCKVADYPVVVLTVFLAPQLGRHILGVHVEQAVHILLDGLPEFGLAVALQILHCQAEHLSHALIERTVVLFLIFTLIAAQQDADIHIELIVND